MRRRWSPAELFQRDLHNWRLVLAQALLDSGHARDAETLDRLAWQALDAMLFVRACEVREVLPVGYLRRLAATDAPLVALLRHSGLDTEVTTATTLPTGVLMPVVVALYEAAPTRLLADRSSDVFGRMYEDWLIHSIEVMDQGQGEHRLRVVEQPGARRKSGVYYTPRNIVEHVVAGTVGALFAGKTPRQVRAVKIVDPACGAGAFLLCVYQYLQAWYRDAYLRAGLTEPNPDYLEADPNGGWRLAMRERVEILERHIYGLDIDPDAVALTRRALQLEALAGVTANAQIELFPQPDWPDVRVHLRVGNALVGPDITEAVADGGSDIKPDAIAALHPFDWQASFPEVFERNQGGFDAVIGNPPWGQKGIEQPDLVKAYLRDRFESLSGIFDMYRPFVEQGVKLLCRHAGRFGMVLPDIILLKDYPATRKYLLDNLTLTDIDWWGMAFPGAVIDAATILGQKRRARRNHTVGVTIHEAAGETGEAWAHRIPQRVFQTNERYVFNLLLTKDKRRVLDRMSDLPRLGELYEAHEGVHSGNIRKELFVDHEVDESCRPMYFGRDEIGPYRLIWRGRYLRLSAMPAHRSRERYANIGQASWFERDKVLVRRTGDHLVAAVDRSGRYASNNFFVVLPRTDIEAGSLALGLDGLTALLSSRLMTWYFRTIEPRTGRVFAELKIKHLTVFPLPVVIGDAKGCADLDAFGRERARIEQDAKQHAEQDAKQNAEQDEELAMLVKQGRELDVMIDRAVYALYGLRPAEIRIIEKS